MPEPPPLGLVLGVLLLPPLGVLLLGSESGCWPAFSKPEVICWTTDWTSGVLAVPLVALALALAELPPVPPEEPPAGLAWELPPNGVPPVVPPGEPCLGMTKLQGQGGAVQGMQAVDPAVGRSVKGPAAKPSNALPPHLPRLMACPVSVGGAAGAAALAGMPHPQVCTIRAPST